MKRSLSQRNTTMELLISMRCKLYDILERIIEELDGDVSDEEIGVERDALIKMIEDKSNKLQSLKVFFSQEYWSQDHVRPCLRIIGYEPVGTSEFARMALESAVAILLQRRVLPLTIISGEGTSIHTIPWTTAAGEDPNAEENPLKETIVVQEIGRRPIKLGEVAELDEGFEEECRVLSNFGYHQCITVNALTVATKV